MLSGPHQKFAEGIAAGLNQTEAYMAAYPKAKYDSARAKAPLLFANDSIQSEVASLRKAVKDEFALTQKEWLESFLRIGKKAELAGDHSAAKGCLREIGLAMPGWYAPDKVKVESEAIIHVSIGT